MRPPGTVDAGARHEVLQAARHASDKEVLIGDGRSRTAAS
jgi:hypothetical protein